jgi:adenosyl cobinamide kinase/adenosyl cobinamide phosphate guanylyltransferase
MPLVLLIGGARSGKSQMAQKLAAGQSAPVVVIATGEAGDEEMSERIARHRRARPASWRTVEEPLHLRETIEGLDGESCVIVDCLTLWTANALERLGAAAAEAHAAAAAVAALSRRGLTIAVTNEVGLGLVPDNPLGRSYRDLLGKVNTIWADAASEVLLLVAGRTLTLEKADAAIERFVG